MSEPPTTQPIIAGRYRCDARLGQTRMALVLQGFDLRLQRPVLVHLLRRDLMAQEQMRQRFTQQIRAAAMVAHRSLLEVYDTGEVSERPFLITELIEGRTLHEIGALSLEETLLYLRQVAGAVATCQAAGVPHPPISAVNLILVEDGHVELVENWRIPPGEMALEIACYRAPERTAGGAPHPTASVYALGLLLAELLSGKRLINGNDPRSIAEAHEHLRPLRLADLSPSLAVPQLDALLQRATAYQPGARFADAADLLQELDALWQALTRDTRRLPQPPRLPLRERIRRSTGQYLAMVRPQPDPPDDPDAPPERRGAGRWAQPPERTRPLLGLSILVILFVIVGCGAYYGASIAVEALSGFRLPRPELQVPTGVPLPEWITGTVGGEGDILTVTIGDIEGLNLRSAPGLGSDIIALLPNGTQVRKLEGPNEADGVSWLRVRAQINGQTLEGWVSERFVR